jgi:hypothetical protein
MSAFFDVDHIRLIPVCFPISWAYWFVQPIRQQGFGTNNFKAKASALLHQQLDSPVKTLSVASSVAVSEIVEDRITVVLNCQDKWQEGFSNVWGDLCEPSEVARERLFLCGSLVDVVERFLQAICRLKAGEVSQLCLQDQGIMLREVFRMFEQQMLIVHQGSSLAVRKRFTNLFAHGLQALREHFQDVPFVYDQLCLWQDLANDLVVVGIHIGAHDGNLFAYCCGQPLQVEQQSGFIPVSQKLYDRVMLQIAQDAARLVQEVQLIDSQDSHGLFLPSWLKAGAVFLEEQANRTFRQSDFIGDADKGSVQRLLLDVGSKTPGGEMMFIHIGKCFKEGAATSTAQVAPSMNGDPNALPSYGQIHIPLELLFVLMDLWVLTEGTANRRREALRLDVDVVLILVYAQNTQRWESQKVQEMLSQRKGLPHKFSVMAEFPVARDGRLPRLLRVTCFHPTHFYDCEVMCWSKKHAVFPRSFTNIRSG